MADERLLMSVKSVIIAIHNETLAFEIPPTIRLNKNITKTLDIDHIIYEINVPNLKIKVLFKYL